jgi:tetratricopeptide (TPR) repeat protein
MRGLAYLQFAWCWGGSPLITTDLSLAELRKVKTFFTGKTYQQAIKEFELAYDLLPEKEAAQKWDVLPICNGGMLGRTYLYRHNPAKAVEWLAADNAKKPLYIKWPTNYEDCFDDKFDNTSERVWEVQYMGGSTG